MAPRGAPISLSVRYDRGNQRYEIQAWAAAYLAKGLRTPMPNLGQGRKNMDTAGCGRKEMKNKPPGRSRLCPNPPSFYTLRRVT